jgi:N-succinyldiaminopimelate aminotransferase
MNPHLSELQPYPFEKLAKLKGDKKPPADLPAILLSVGEPQHPAPDFVKGVIDANLAGLSKYPVTTGSIELRTAIADWVSRRFRIAQGLLDPERNVIPVNGTREALFSIVQCLVDPTRPDPLVLMPNPFYQIYEGAALLSGAQPYYINATAATDWNPDYDTVPDDVWQRCQLLFLCVPGNPTGSVPPYATLNKLVELADRFDFTIVSDECYSEIYFDDLAPPPGLLEVCAEEGRGNFERCLIFHSLSKRSSLPGMRSGFVAGDASLIDKYRLYRTYHGCAMSPVFQAVSTAAWRDEKHVIANRELYRKTFAEVLDILQPVMDIRRPDAGFYLWAHTPIPDEQFAATLFERYNLTVLPGSYLSRTAHGLNPGADYVRMALVATLEETIEAAKRLRAYMTEINTK